MQSFHLISSLRRTTLAASIFAAPFLLPNSALHAQAGREHGGSLEQLFFHLVGGAQTGDLSWL